MIEIQTVKFYNLLEVARELAVTVQTLRRYIKTGRLRAQRVGRSILISEQDLREFLNIRSNG